ncbi:MAG: glycosyltransferase family 2 protein [Candidatus Dojkabacteria bacterium]|nr:glycosyltransferase family 2 protein [Candidatus Dojkabacteria bacterium]MDQ7020250.1 glycosyltransferase family 2 protein [Candidatus Dojkabacteria bacterium]
MSRNKHVSVVIVTWNNEDDIKECLDTILKQDYKNYKVIVFDNASNDKTLEIVKSYKDSKLALLTSKKNLYLTGGNNFGIKIALENYNSDFIMVLNPDTKVEENLISELVKTIESDEQIGAVGPLVKFYQTENEGNINSAGLIYDGFMQAYDIGFDEKDNGQYNRIEERWGVSGTCILYRTEMLKQIGLYWKQIKLHLDEVELFIRANKKGWKVIFNPNTVVHHRYGISTKQNPDYKMSKAKRKAWLKIALKHYRIKSKIAMIKKYLFH